MDLLSSEWLLWLVLLLLGLVIGYIIGRNNNTDLKAQNQLTAQLFSAQEQLDEYKEQVELHFADTAEAVNAMTDSYRRVHQSLRKGAQQLCDDPATMESLTMLGQPSEKAVVSEQGSPAAVRPPKDYAPKTEDEETGTLDERYGLDEQESIVQPSYDIPVAPDK